MEIDDADFEVIKRAVENGADTSFWLSRTPEERIIGTELMRRRLYGYDEHSMPRMQKVFEVVDMKRYKLQTDNPSDPPNES